MHRVFWGTQSEAAEVRVAAPLCPLVTSLPDSIAYPPHKSTLVVTWFPTHHPSARVPCCSGPGPPATQEERSLVKAHPFTPLAGCPPSTVSIPKSAGLIPLPGSAREGTMSLTSSRIVFLMLRALVALKYRYTPNSARGPTMPSRNDTEKSSPRFSSPLSRQATGSGVRFRRTRVLLSLL